jgi:hypothetical protein
MSHTFVTIKRWPDRISFMDTLRLCMAHTHLKIWMEGQDPPDEMIGQPAMYLRKTRGMTSIIKAALQMTGHVRATVRVWAPCLAAPICVVHQPGNDIWMCHEIDLLMDGRQFSIVNIA